MTQSAAQLVPPTAEPELPVLEGQVIADRYRVGCVIGEGGMGVVCEAIHIGLGTPVAIKVIRSDLKHDPEAVTRFFNEARTAASLKGEHIARVYDVGQLDSGEPYLVMERLEGKSLDLLIAERGRVSPPEAVDLVLQACEGLSEAHAVALVHRDIKPGNLFLAQRPDGQATVKILDFGISKRLVDDARRHFTDPGRSMGSPWYMSPEQMMNPTAVDQRADVWSLGVLLFELLTNETPFNGDTVVQVCAAVLTHHAPTPSSLCADVDPALDSIVLRCLEKEPSERFPTVTALAEALRPFSSNPLATTAPTPVLSDMLEPAGDAAPAARPPSSRGNSDELVLEPVGFSALSSSNPQRAWTPLSTRAVHLTPATRAREFATSESLAPVSAQDLPMRPGWSRGFTVGVSLIAGVAMAWLALPFLQQNFGVPTWAELERQPLPNEPTLASGPDPEPARFESLTLRVPEIEWIRVANGAPNAAPKEVSAPAPAQRAAERRAANARYERWLSEHNLMRVGSVSDSSGSSPAPISSPAPSVTEPPPVAVEPAPPPSPPPPPVNDPYGLEPTTPSDDPYPAPSPNPTRPTDRSDLQEPYP